MKIRASSLSGYSDCPRRSAARMFSQVLKKYGYKFQTGRTSVGAIVGTAIHAGIGNTLKNRMERQKIGNETESIQVGMQSLDNELVSQEVLWDSTTPTKSTGYIQIERTIKSFREYVAPKVTPVAIELHLEATLPSGNILSGHPDYLEQLTVHDLKTGAGKRRPNGAQYGAYSLLCAANGMPISNIQEEFLRRTPVRHDTCAPEIHNYSREKAEKTAWNIISCIERDYKLFLKTGTPCSFTANPASMLCSEKYCRAWGTDWCEEHL